MISDACAKSSGRYTEPLIKEFAASGLWQIWFAVDDAGICAVAGTEMITYPTGLKVIAIRFGTGRERLKWQHFMEDVVAWGRSQGCTMAEGAFRRGWKRVLPGWHHGHDSLERAL
jgi:hypothetical protein